MADREEFERLAGPLLPGLYYAARAFAPNAADDLLQETLLKAWRGFGGYRRGTNFRAWLATILRHAAVDRARAIRLEPLPLDETRLADAPAVDAALPEDVEAALAKLPAMHRVLVVLCDVQGLKYREIADALDIPIGTVMSGLHAARAKLREYLAREDR